MEWLNWEMPIWLCVIFFLVFSIVFSVVIELIRVRFSCGFWPSWSMIVTGIFKKNKKAAG